MPHIWNNILVVTADELVPAWYRSISTLLTEIQRYKTKECGIKRVRKGGNGRPMLVAYDSLRAEIRAGLGEQTVLEKLRTRRSELATKLPLGYKEKIARRAGVTPEIVTAWMMGKHNSLRIELSALAELQALKALLNEIL